MSDPARERKLKPEPLHRWDVEPAEARRIQDELAPRVQLEPLDENWRFVAGLDISYNRGDDWLCAAAVLVDREGKDGPGTVIATTEAIRHVPFPYVPGLLSFREAPPLIEVVQALPQAPDVLLCDGQGLAHPRRLGIACHLGLWFDLPSVGCAKSRLCGDAEEPGPNRGARTPLIHRDERVGYLLRTRDRVKPVWVSAGHRCTHEDAVAVTLGLLTRYRLPEPARLAHQCVNRLRQQRREGPQNRSSEDNRNK